jgi:hypothetical protein
MVIAGLPHEPPIADATQINREVREAGGEADQKLKAKCQWDGMSRTAVIREWGDPRSWPNVKGEARADSASPPHDQTL